MVVATIAALVCTGAPSSVAAQGPGQAQAASSERVEAEAAIARTNLGRRMEVALGDAFGGVWFEASTAQMHVGVTSPASRRIAEAVAAKTGLSEIVTETSVDSTWAQLLAAQEAWNRRLADLFAREEVSTSVAADLNSVMVSLGSLVPRARHVALEREASAADVDVSVATVPEPYLRLRRLAQCRKFEKSKGYCDPSIAAGITIQRENKGLCTAGPAVMSKDLTKATLTYILTAGHCIASGGGNDKKWYAYPKEATMESEKVELGKSVKYLNSTFDVGVIQVENAAWMNKGFTPVDPRIAQWSTTAESEPEPVKDLTKPMKGAKTCFSGQSSGLTCAGTIKETNRTYAKVETLVEVEGVRTIVGDSGAPFFSEAAKNTAEGTFVGSGIVKEEEVEFFHSLESSFETLNKEFKLDLKVLTEGNKLRHAYKMQAEAAPATLTGSQVLEKDDVIETTAGTMKCGGAAYIGSVSEKEVSEIEVTPSYSNCTVGFASATVDLNSCTYRFTVVAIVEEDREGSIDIICPEGKEIVVTASLFGTPKCTIHVPPQNDLNTVTYTNAGSGATREVLVDVELSGIKYSHTAGTGIGACSTGSAENGTYKGEATVTAENGSGHVGIFTS